jgi:tetratricopeptide (TPR) repeat protein
MTMGAADNLNAAIKELLQLPDTADAIGRGYELVLEITRRIGEMGPLDEISDSAKEIITGALLKGGEYARVLGRTVGKSPPLTDAVKCYDLALTLMSPMASPADWAQAQRRRAGALRLLGDFAKGAERTAYLSASVTGYDEALKVLSPDDAPAERATTQMNRANALMTLAGAVDADQGQNLLFNAVAAYDEALGVLSAERDGEAWATTQMNRATALYKLGSSIGGDAGVARLHEALAGYDAAATLMTKSTAPEDYAIIQMNKANVLLSLGDWVGGPAGQAHLRDAAHRYDEALDAAPQQKHPALWAKIHSNRATTLRRLGDMLDGDEGLGFFRQALSSYDDALEIRNRKTMAVAWATVQAQRANLLARLGDRLGGEPGRPHLESALTGYAAALEIINTETAPVSGARIHENRATALQYLSNISKGDERLDYLRRAASDHDAALSVLTPTGNSADWSKVQIGHGSVSYRLGLWGNQTDSVQHLRDAVAHFDAALTVRKRDAMPGAWASAEINRGIALRALGGRLAGAERREVLELALASFAECIEALDAGASMTQRMRAENGYIRTLALLENWGEVAQAAQRVLNDAPALLLDAATEADQIERIGLVAGFGDLAGYALARLNRVADAVVAVEAGRTRRFRDDLRMAEAVLSAQDRDRLTAQRRKLEDLRRRHRALSDKWPVNAEARNRHAADVSALAENLRREHQTFRDLLGDLGRIGEGIPLHSLIFRTSAAVAPGGAAVMVALTETDGAAFILPSGADCAETIRVVDLPGFGTQRLDELLEPPEHAGWFDAYDAYRADLHQTKGRGSAAGLTAWNDNVAAILEALWASFMALIDTALRDMGLAEGAEIALIVPGRLSVLPLHAAGVRTDGRWNCFFDRWSVAYAPSLSTQAARKPFAAVAPGAAYVPAVIDPLGDLFIGHSSALPAFFGKEFDPLMGPEATRAVVLDKLPQADYACFDCHGLWNPADPDRSGLVLAGGALLTPTDIRTSDMARCRLAALGACETGLTGVRQSADEQHGLPLAFLQAGVGAVAATFWPLFNATAALIVGELFKRHRQGGTPPAAALRQLLLSIRDGAGSAEARLEARAAVWGNDDEAAPPPPTPVEELARRRLIRDLSQPMHWAVYAIFGA